MTQPDEQEARLFWRHGLLLTLVERLCDLSATAVIPWYVLDAERRPVRCHSIVEWGEFTESMARVVGEDLVAGGRLSTTCVGWDLSPKMTAKGRPPLTFETMWFNHVECGDDRLFGRYFTWDEAERGHAAALQKLQAGVEEDDPCSSG